MSETEITATIMIVDDDPENLRVLGAMLSREGYVVRSFPGGKPALRSVMAEPPDLILLDIRMPEMDGFEVCAQIKSFFSLKDIPVIFLSAIDETEGKVQAFKLGGTDYITKPFQADEVLARVKTHLSVAKLNSRLRTLNRQLEQRVRERTADLEASNTELKQQIEERLEAVRMCQVSEEKYRRIVTTANEGIATTDENFRIVYANDELASILGGSVQEIVGQKSIDFIIEEDRQIIEVRFRQRMRGVKGSYECRIQRLDGQIIWGYVSAAPIMDRHNKFVGSVALFTDISERKQAEIALRQSKEFNQATLMSLQDHIAVLDRIGNILAVNDSWIRFAQENDAGSLDRIGQGANYIDICKESMSTGSDGAKAAMDGIKSVLEGRIENFEFEYDCHSPDEERWFLMKVLPFKGQKGGAIVTHQNITERKQSEIELRQAYEEISRLKNQIEADNIYLQEEIKLEHNFDQIIGNSDEIKYALFRLEQVAKTDSAVVILGETGTGKELIARALHHISTRAARTLIKVNCATLPEQFIESELFGHVKGAFTGASNNRQGRFELADGGTLFLDEIGELPPALQAKLLRVLQDGEFERLGESRTIRTNVRLITATNRDLEALVKAGKFREDLWYRLNVFPITLPPLRDRKEDIPLLVNHFVKKIGKRIGKEISQIPAKVLTELTSYDWPGNVRELEHMLERSIITSHGGRLHLTEKLVPSTPKTMHENIQTHSDMEREHILRILDQAGWVIEGPRGAAKILDIHPNTLRYRMKKLSIKRPGK